MSPRTVLVPLLCLLLMLPGTGAIAGAWTHAVDAARDDVQTPDAMAPHAPRVAEHGASSGHPGCHDTPTPTDMDAASDTPADPAGHPCCGHCDCGCLPAAAFAFTPAPIARTLPVAPMTPLRLPAFASGDPPLLRPPIA